MSNVLADSGKGAAASPHTQDAGAVKGVVSRPSAGACSVCAFSFKIWPGPVLREVQWPSCFFSTGSFLARQPVLHLRLAMTQHRPLKAFSTCLCSGAIY